MIAPMMNCMAESREFSRPINESKKPKKARGGMPFAAMSMEESNMDYEIMDLR